VIKVKLAYALSVLPIFNWGQHVEAQPPLITNGMILSEAFVKLEEFPALLAMLVK